MICIPEQAVHMNCFTLRRYCLLKIKARTEYTLGELQRLIGTPDVVYALQEMKNHGLVDFSCSDGYNFLLRL